MNFDSFYDLRGMSVPVCLYIRRKQVILPVNRDTARTGRELKILWGLYEKGALIKRHKTGQIYLDIPDADLPAYVDAIEQNIQVYQWKGKAWGGLQWSVESWPVE
ncbi:MAG: hypothetical protein ACSHX3_16945 [Litorimonas sp.]